MKTKFISALLLMFLFLTPVFSQVDVGGTVIPNWEADLTNTDSSGSSTIPNTFSVEAYGNATYSGNHVKGTVEVSTDGKNLNIYQAYAGANFNLGNDLTGTLSAGKIANFWYQKDGGVYGVYYYLTRGSISKNLVPVNPIGAPALLLTACSKESEDSMLLNAKNKLEEGKKLEGESKPEEAKKAYGEAVELYKKFLTEYPSSPKAPEVYSSIAKIYVDNLRDYPNAVKYYEELTQKHPNTKESKYGMFMVAFIYDEMLKDKEKAKVNYKKFLDKYPKDEDPNEKMSESARMMLQMLDENRSIEDIIKNTQKDSVKTDGKKDNKTDGKPDDKTDDTKKEEIKKEAPPKDTTKK